MSTTSSASPRRRASSAGRVGRASVRIVAIWEAVKGILVLVAAGAAVRFLHPDAQQAVDRIVAHFHLNPGGHTSRIFERAADHMNNTHLVLLAAGAAAYALLRFVEAYGLFFRRRWGWILASAAIYLPFEVLELVRRFTWLGVALFAVNLAIIAILWRNRENHGPEAA